MSEAKFTAGPWRVHPGTWSIHDPDGDAIKTGPGTEFDANAHLIAAAPQLYEALEAVAGHLFGHDPENAANFARDLATCDQCRKKIRAALASARGEEVA